jgi:hypothetical protein
MHGSETVAPMMDTEPAWDVMNNTISQAEYTNPDSNRNNSYRFDHSFGPMDDNSDIYQNTVRDTVISAMEGYHASVFAYGQTATGKTFTMTGGGGGREGIIQMSIRDCFDYIQSQNRNRGNTSSESVSWRFTMRSLMICSQVRRGSRPPCPQII